MPEEKKTHCQRNFSFEAIKGGILHKTLRKYFLNRKDEVASKY